MMMMMMWPNQEEVMASSKLRNCPIQANTRADLRAERQFSTPWLIDIAGRPEALFVGAHCFLASGCSLGLPARADTGHISCQNGSAHI